MEEKSNFKLVGVLYIFSKTEFKFLFSVFREYNTNFNLYSSEKNIKYTFCALVKRFLVSV